MELEAPAQRKDPTETELRIPFSSTISRKESDDIVEQWIKHKVSLLPDLEPLAITEDKKLSKYCPYHRKVRHSLLQSTLEEIFLISTKLVRSFSRMVY